jgi:hypothetical protein
VGFHGKQIGVCGGHLAAFFVMVWGVKKLLSAVGNRAFYGQMSKRDSGFASSFCSMFLPRVGALKDDANVAIVIRFRVATDMSASFPALWRVRLADAKVLKMERTRADQYKMGKDARLSSDGRATFFGLRAVGQCT